MASRKEEEERPRTWHITKGMSKHKVDLEEVIRNTWQYIMDYTPEMRASDQVYTPIWDEEVVLAICKKAVEIVKPYPFIIDIEGEMTVFGPLYGQGDSFISLISAVGLPPKRQYLFLGNFTGLGFASFECLMMALCFKCLYPDRVHLLRGTNEDRQMNYGLRTLTAMSLRGIVYEGLMANIIYTLDTFFANMPLIARLPNKIWAISGGIGPHIINRGMEKLMEVKKEDYCYRTLSDGKVMQELMWGCLHPNNMSDYHLDGVPTFNEEQITKFCKKNDIKMILRGRQLTANGVLHYPKCVMTVSSSCALFDLFENDGACLTLIGNRAVIHRIKMADPEVHTLDYAKIGMGRNAMR